MSNQNRTTTFPKKATCCFVIPDRAALPEKRRFPIAALRVAIFFYRLQFECFYLLCIELYVLIIFFI